MRRGVWCVLAALVLAFWCSSAAAEGTGQIFGQVVRADGTTLSGVEVSVTELGQSRVTGPTGTFRFDGVPVGEYTLVFRLADNSQTTGGIKVTAAATTLVEQRVEWEATAAETFTVFAASRRTQRLVEAPAAVSILTGADIAPQTIHGQVPALLSYVAGADVTQSSLWDYNFNTRAFNSSLNRRVLVLIDGRDPVGVLLGAQEWPAFPFPLSDLSSLELVRGPGSALYGANAYNGVLNITTQEPRYSLGGVVRVGGGELDTLTTEFREAMELGKGWYGKVFGAWETSSDWSMSRDLGTEYPGLPTEAVPLRDLDTQRYNAGLRLDKYFESGALLTAELGGANAEGPVFQTGIGRVQVIDSKRPWARVNFNTAHFNVLGYWDGREAQQVSLSSGDNVYDDSQKWHVEVQANTTFAGERGRIVGGVSYRHESVDTQGRQNLYEAAQAFQTGSPDYCPDGMEVQGDPFSDPRYCCPAIPDGGPFDGQCCAVNLATNLCCPVGTSLDPNSRQCFVVQQTIIGSSRDEHSQAAFAQVEFNFTDNLLGMVAARWDDSSLHDAQVSPKAALVYSVNPNHALRLKYDEAFQTPSYLDRFLRIPVAQPVDLSVLEQALAPVLGGVPLGFDNVPVLALGNEHLEVEEIISYEVGYSGIFAGKLLVNLTYYQSELDNFVTELLPLVNSDYGPYQTPAGLSPAAQAAVLASLQAVLPPELYAVMSNDPDGSPIFAARSYTNFGKAEAEGAELGFSYFFSDWELFLNYSWFDYTIEEQLAGSELFPNSPENRVSAGFSFARSNYDISVRGRWVDSFVWSAGLFAGEVPSYEVVDLSANYRFAERWQLGLYVSNAMDNDHFETFGGDLLRRRAIVHMAYRW